jgi:hypothetical protein
MKSLKHALSTPKGFPLVADGITELHASRILLLLKRCGTSGKIDGLTKLAKLDFFVRYPDFFDQMSQYIGSQVKSHSSGVESAMVRHHYGPWDKRYYQVLSYLSSRGLISISKDGNAYRFKLTDLGKSSATELERASEFGDLVEQMRRVKILLGAKTGSTIKNLIYQAFDAEVAKKAMGELI